MTLLMKECMRWYGPDDQVPLTHIVQAGASGIYTSLHDIGYGEIWSREAIRKRKQVIEEQNLHWVAVESLPVHEEIKTRTGKYSTYIQNYCQSLTNLGQEGITLVIYNFMPVLDWVRTDLAYTLEDGTECLLFDPVHFAAFDIHVLKRKGAETDFSETQVSAADSFYTSLSDSEKADFAKSIIDIFPGYKFGLSVEDIRSMIASYRNIDSQTLKQNHYAFLKEVLPTAEAAGIKLAVHPDDPPFPILGLPRIVSTEQDVQELFQAIDNPTAGLCFCSGSFSPRADNDLPKMVQQFGSRIHCAHLRSTQRNPDGSFYEANHLEGSIDMYEIVDALLQEMQKRKSDGKKNYQIPFRPDHGHTMLDDLEKKPPENPGYSAIGRLRGLAEIRGLQLGIARSKFG